MATDKTGTWSLGESVIWYTPTSNLDPMWSLGESAFLDEYIVRHGGIVNILKPVITGDTWLQDSY